MTLNKAYFRETTFSDELDHLRKFKQKTLGDTADNAIPSSAIGIGDEVQISDTVTVYAAPFVIGTAKIRQSVIQSDGVGVIDTSLIHYSEIG